MCLEGGASHIEAKLEERARLSCVIASKTSGSPPRASRMFPVWTNYSWRRPSTGAGMSVLYRVLRVLKAS